MEDHHLKRALFSFLFFPFTIVLVVKIFKTTTKRRWRRRLPPGPPKLPIIGNIHQLLGSLPHHAMRRLPMTHGPIMHPQLGQISAIVLSSPQIAREVTKTHEAPVLNRPELLVVKFVAYDGQGLVFSPYGPYWRQMRKVCALHVLSNTTVQSFSYIRQDEVAKLIESAATSSSSASPFNVSEKGCFS